MPRINIAIASQGLPHERCGACDEVIARGLPMYEVVEQRSDSPGWAGGSALTMKHAYTTRKADEMRRRLVDRSARCISHLLCPPCVATAGIVFAAAVQPSAKGWLCAGAYLVLAILGPLLALFWLLRRGRVSDLDVTLREERLMPFIAALCGAVAACGSLYLLNAPGLLMHVALAHTAVFCIVFVVTMYWKISVHSAGVAGVATLVATVLGTQTVAFVPLVLVAWSRVYLGRHTFPQVVAGGLLGTTLFVLLLSTP